MKLRIFSCLLLIIMTGCANVPTLGQPINFAKLERLSVGISSQETVKENFGYPQFIEYPDNRTIYKYRFSSSEAKQAIDFVFNKQQRLIDITINEGW